MSDAPGGLQAGADAMAAGIEGADNVVVGKRNVQINVGDDDKRHARTSEPADLDVRYLLLRTDQKMDALANKLDQALAGQGKLEQQIGAVTALYNGIERRLYTVEQAMRPAQSSASDRWIVVIMVALVAAAFLYIVLEGRL